MSLIRKNREDSITLAGVRLRPRIGTTQQERETPQECLADLTIWGDFERAGESDSLEESIDYSAVLSTVKSAAVARTYSLVETLAYRIVRDVLKQFAVSRVRVRVRKRPAALAEDLDFVEVEVEESTV